jgi:hypothetical protein
LGNFFPNLAIVGNRHGMIPARGDMNDDFPGEGFHDSRDEFFLVGAVATNWPISFISSSPRIPGNNQKTIIFFFRTISRLRRRPWNVPNRQLAKQTRGFRRLLLISEWRVSGWCHGQVGRIHFSPRNICELELILGKSAEIIAQGSNAGNG